MTTVAYDGSSIAADALSCADNERMPNDSRKIMAYRIPKQLGPGHGGPEEVGQRVIIGFAGHRSFAAKLLEHYIKSPRVMGTTPAIMGKGEATLLIYQVDDGEAYMMPYDGGSTRITGQKMAIGSGRAYALGAMEHGASSFDAVKVAEKLDVFTRGLYWIDLEKLVDGSGEPVNFPWWENA